MDELLKVLTKGEAKAILRKCEDEKISVIEFLCDFALAFADDEFSDMLAELCDKYDIDMFEGEDELPNNRRGNIFF